jgi:hypothetical protein
MFSMKFYFFVLLLVFNVVVSSSAPAADQVWFFILFETLARLKAFLQDDVIEPSDNESRLEIPVISDIERVAKLAEILIAVGEKVVPVILNATIPIDNRKRSAGLRLLDLLKKDVDAVLVK